MELYNILFAYDGDITEVENEFGVQFATVPEFIPNRYTGQFKTTQEIIDIYLFMRYDENGSDTGLFENIGVWNYPSGTFAVGVVPNIVADPYTIQKYIDQFPLVPSTLDVENNPQNYQVNKYLGMADRELIPTP